jgi:hypothetical protein
VPNSKKQKNKSKYKKLSRKEQKLASKFIAEEIKTHKYKPKQAKAIGISRARKAAKKAR